MALVLENSVWKLQADSSGSTSSTVIYSIDFSDISDHDFTATGSLDIGGVTWTAENASNAAAFDITSSVLAIQPNVSTAWVTNTWTAPRIKAPWSALMSSSAGGVYDPAKSYAWRAILLTGSSPSAGGGFIGMRTGTAAKRDITMEASGTSWRVNRGAVTYLDIARSATGVTGPMRTLAVVYAQGSFRTLSSTSATHEGEAFGGVPILSGYGNIAYGSLNYLAAGVFPLDLSSALAEAYVGAWWYSGGSGPGTVAISRLELHEVG